MNWFKFGLVWFGLLDICQDGGWMDWWKDGVQINKQMSACREVVCATVIE